jgi:hypothetical protein
VITISADDARNELGGGTAFAFETQDWRRNGCARNLIGLILERNSVTVSPDAPKLKSFSVATPKSGTIPRSKFSAADQPTSGKYGNEGDRPNDDDWMQNLLAREFKSENYRDHDHSKKNN